MFVCACVAVEMRDLQGMEVIFRVGIAILMLNLDDLRCLDMEDTIKVSLELVYIPLTYGITTRVSLGLYLQDFFTQ